MKLSALLAMTLSMAVLSACSKGGTSSNTAVPGAQVKASDTASHKASSCLEINGEFVNETDKQDKQNVKTSKTQNGVSVKASGAIWEIDGQPHAINDDENPDMSYVGVCADDSISLDFFKGSKHLGKEIWSLNGRGELILERQSNEESVVPSSKSTFKKVGDASEEVSDEGSDDGAEDSIELQ